MVPIFHFKGDLLGIKSRRELKENAIPTLFDHVPLSKKRRMSIAQLQNQTNRQIIEDALFQAPEEIEENPPSVSTTTTNNLGIHQVDKAIDNTSKMKSTHTQYRISHFKQESLIPPKVSTPLLVKAPQRKKHRDAAVNTTVSFKPEDEVEMIVQTQTVTGKIQEKQADSDDEISDDELADPSYIPEEPTDYDKSQQTAKDKPIKSHTEETKYLVFWFCLLPLFCYCLKYLAYATIKRSVLKGSMLIVTLLCAENHETVWYSQPNLSGMATGNIFLSAAILFTGNTFQRIKELMDVINISFISHTTFNKIQKKYLFPAINKVYTTNRQVIIDNAVEKGDIDLLGDARCDSPGYNTRYGMYTVLDKNSGLILDFNVSHVRIAGNSARMELDGLKQVLERLGGHGLPISSLTTDRHKQVRRYMCKEKGKINHQFDVWHVTKNI